MFKIYGKRGSGRTVALIEKAYFENAIIVTISQPMCKIVLDRAKQFGFQIKNPITYDEYIKYRSLYIHKKILIDDIELFFNALHMNITGFVFEDTDCKYIGSNKVIKFLKLIYNKLNWFFI